MKITDKERLNKLEESQKILWLIINTMPSKIFWKDSNFKYLGCNKEFAKDLGYKMGEIIGKDDYEIQRKELADIYRKEDEKVMKTGIPKLNIEKRLLKDRGEKRWIRFNKIPLYDCENNIYGLFGNWDDITEEKEMKRKLEENQARIEELVKLSRAIVWEVDKDGLCIYISPVVEDLFGYSPDEIIGKKIS